MSTRAMVASARRLEHLRWMVLARVLDDRMCSLKKQDMIAGGVYTGRGQEAFAAAGGMCLRPGDMFAPLIRDLAGRLAFGEPVLEHVRSSWAARPARCAAATATSTAATSTAAWCR